MTTERQFSTAEIVERIDKRFSALTWENFLKLLANGDKEDRARTYLQQKLQGYLVRQPAEFHAPLLQTPEEDTAELNAFLKGKLKPKKSKIWPLLRKIEGSEDDAEYEESLELRRKYFGAKETITTAINLNNDFFEQLNIDIEWLTPKINGVPFTPDYHELEAAFKTTTIEVRKLRRQLTKFIRKYEEQEDAMAWAANDNLRQNPSGVHASVKWAAKILEELNVIGIKAEKLMDDLEKIKERLKQLDADKIATKTSDVE